jgi:hypothetical protein
VYCAGQGLRLEPSKGAFTVLYQWAPMDGVLWMRLSLPPPGDKPNLRGIRPMKKGVTPQQAAEMIPDGAILMIGGFMGVGSPHRIIDALVELGRKNLKIGRAHV